MKIKKNLGAIISDMAPIQKNENHGYGKGNYFAIQGITEDAYGRHK